MCFCSTTKATKGQQVHRSVHSGHNIKITEMGKKGRDTLSEGRTTKVTDKNEGKKCNM